MKSQQTPPNRAQGEAPASKNITDPAPSSSLLRKQLEEFKDHVRVLAEKQMDASIQILRRWINS